MFNALVVNKDEDGNSNDVDEGQKESIKFLRIDSYTAG